ncbi:hypothetical protein MAR_028679 [Mya arenaria]|uniref:Uncharacterized protein n=1 Tax=Mya arenaria TaxID=6604 RepID=A0ABY7DHP6_MYAAR|nr:hypothetical protein MAR_028679 [Mya arenaria]
MCYFENRQEAVRDVHTPAGRDVGDKMVETFGRGRTSINSKEPTSLDFEFNADYLGEDFLVGDVRMGDERHMVYATADQLRLLQKVRTWYLDGTFSVVNKPAHCCGPSMPEIANVKRTSRFQFCVCFICLLGESYLTTIGEGVYQHVQELLALPFLPSGDILRAFEKMKDRSDGNSQQKD